MSLSLKPSDAKPMADLSGALVTIRNPLFVIQEFEPKGADGKPRGKKQEKTKLRLEFYLEGIEKPIVRHYNVSDAAIICPSQDGHKLEAAEGRDSETTTLNDNCTFVKFQKHLVDAGFPEDEIEEDIAFLDGVKVQLLSVTETYKGLVDEKTGRDATGTYEFPQKYVGKAGGASAGKAAKKGAVAAADAQDDEKDQVVATVIEILSEEGTLTKPQLTQRVTKKLSGSPLMRKALGLVSSDVFLKTGEAWTFENGKISLVGGE
jgi:hypothetical protein